ncbi:undecaprenyl phosphate translocase family protein [Natranaerobius thermophilus]|uniref:Membrane protein-like protein n=1 Tax=Natranaerobius thermophilus (strain ATCC BAA-1301 / DSM 18059 / JW/NM-WN-LF) TaxID=457570 RepID=B2A2Q4_NATTJ|nr:DUF368 domain-containing protein [Natranaerobius thermophilus]ACB86272.1 membrane protein-like protein [Natranaerobius thermophilus JW/NM-WN-LF]
MKVVKKFKPIALAISGAFIGIANLVPGISGGTVAIVFGIYDDLIGSFKGIASQDGQRKQHLAFLIPFLTGLLTALFLFARTIEKIMVAYPVPLKLFFIGLILGAVPFIYQKMELSKFRISYLLTAILFFSLPVLLLLYQPGDRPLITDPELIDYGINGNRHVSHIHSSLEQLTRYGTPGTWYW